jgi:hypothetical protein
VELAALQRWEALDELGDGLDWQTDLAPYLAEYGRIGTGPDARGPQLFQIEQRPGFWHVRQVLDDPNGDHGWSVDGVVDLAESDAAGEVVFDEMTVSAG